MTSSKPRTLRQDVVELLIPFLLSTAAVFGLFPIPPESQTVTQFFAFLFVWAFAIVISVGIGVEGWRYYAE